MKKFILILFLTTGVYGFTNSSETGSEKLSDVQLQFIKDNFNWNSEGLLIVNFRQPRNKCPYNQYKNLEKSYEWWVKNYSDLDLENIHNIYVYSNSKKSEAMIDGKNHFADLHNFFLTNFFSNDETCYGVLVINKRGEYRKKAGEYRKTEVREFINRLKQEL
ncbi:hypothetical protein GCM10007103_25630 [Salinimicrobium marinum]|uniref:Uncharacterized protein n=1 Tax=Salinimicrobium marinum TaxID=680283 RepID=A0A918W163_9FLAO|nr:hypothetical protein [Salinimicrobium marinum]GHA43229.1 hypothetical protein GCM10007103_25630 [Salinimicrobium marinum]